MNFRLINKKTKNGEEMEGTSEINTEGDDEKEDNVKENEREDKFQSDSEAAVDRKKMIKDVRKVIRLGAGRLKTTKGKLAKANKEVSTYERRHTIPEARKLFALKLLVLRRQIKLELQMKYVNGGAIDPFGHDRDHNVYYAFGDIPSHIFVVDVSNTWYAIPITKCRVLSKLFDSKTPITEMSTNEKILKTKIMHFVSNYGKIEKSINKFLGDHDKYYRQSLKKYMENINNEEHTAMMEQFENDIELKNESLDVENRDSLIESNKDKEKTDIVFEKLNTSPKHTGTYDGYIRHILKQMPDVNDRGLTYVNDAYQVDLGLIYFGKDIIDKLTKD